MIGKSFLGIVPMMNILDRYGGWPVVEGDQWNFNDWDWLTTSTQIVNDGLMDLILDCHIEVNPNNSTKHILVVRFFLLQMSK